MQGNTVLCGWKQLPQSWSVTEVQLQERAEFDGKESDNIMISIEQALSKSRNTKDRRCFSDVSKARNYQEKYKINMKKLQIEKGKSEQE